MEYRCLGCTLGKGSPIFLLGAYVDWGNFGAGLGGSLEGLVYRGWRGRGVAKLLKMRFLSRKKRSKVQSDPSSNHTPTDLWSCSIPETMIDVYLWLFLKFCSRSSTEKWDGRTKAGKDPSEAWGGVLLRQVSSLVGKMLTWICDWERLRSCGDLGAWEGWYDLDRRGGRFCTLVNGFPHFILRDWVIGI